MGASPAHFDIVLPARQPPRVFGITAIVDHLVQVFVAVVTIPLMVGLTLFVSRTQPGKAMRATAQDPDTAGADGHQHQPDHRAHVPDRRRSWRARPVLSSCCTTTTLYPQGFRFGLNAFTAAVLGGIGNLQGAVLGALVIGEVNAFSDRFLSTNWTQAIVFGVLIAILVFKPTGLLGQQLADRA